MILQAALLLSVFAATLIGIRLFISFSRRREILDIPNERSSHARPVPVGAGLVMAVAILASIIAYEFLEGRGAEYFGSSQLAAYFICSSLLVAVSWLDDLRAVPALLRFTVHTAAAAALVWTSAGWISAFGSLWWLGWIFALVWIVGLTNAYNFMDGIDGIAGTQAVTAGLGFGMLGLASDAGLAGFAGFSIAASGLGFLYFNWQPAKVFMGDAGSAFLGYSFAALPLMIWGERGPDAVSSPWHSGLAALWLTWPFVVDSSLTFLRRLLNGERVWEPHRRHLYQLMVINGWSHSRVSAIYGICGAACAAAFVLSINYSGTDFVLYLVLAASALTLIAAARVSGSRRDRLI